MPELPEAETIRRQLTPQVVGRRVESVWVGKRDILGRRRQAARRFGELAASRRITGIARRGKALLLALDGADTLVVRLGMSGRLIVVRADEPAAPHTHVILGLSGGRDLRYVDPRRFGEVWVARGTDAANIRGLSELGPEPFDRGLRDHFRACLPRRSGGIKQVLMDQGFVAGLGNIYADETLFRVGLHPAQPANTLTDDEIARLCRAIGGVLRHAIRCCGTSANDAAYVDANGRRGSFQRCLAVYQRAGEPCRRCGTPIRRIVLHGRSAHFCPTCQKLRRRKARRR
ncbi:MAG: bifunctional DNA-formamidopyrimidine glycosylase/DNA-(apurinic or apyrimidinic site) lyase [Armatimonadota bacterium]|nr:MAG: bifunctional DNA-formamidopyrimidine glycosylase/DNA-(apurinic or apyrimidinic site) lyase [Armatimonadota bacterium]